MKVYAPGKLIVSGEHAVVHGAPAIAMAVNRYAITTVTPHASPRISLDLTNVTHRSQLTLNALKLIKNRVKRKYKRFINGDFSIREVLHKPFELAQFAMGVFTESLNLSLPHGVSIKVESDIPMGCGMGSSAATILSVMHAISTYLNINVSADTLFKLALEAENMQHGFSSGLDLHVAMQGGCVYMHNNNITSRVAPTMPMFLVNSGTPSTTTGQCVETVAAYFKNSTMVDEFASITNAIDVAMQKNNFNELQSLIRDNHTLLNRIGVVPNKVKQFIEEVESIGGAAKICGAGAVAGDHAGMVLVLINEKNQLTEIATRYHYQVMSIESESRGVYAV